MFRMGALTAGLGLLVAACTSVANGASKLPGQNIDAAVALYGPWSEQATPEGQTMYIWRRTLIAAGERKVCEMRITLGFRRTIGDVVIQGQPDACKLFAIKYVQANQ